MALNVGAGTGAGAGAGLLWPVTQVCMINSPVPGEHLENQSISLILRPDVLIEPDVHTRINLVNFFA